MLPPRATVGLSRSLNGYTQSAPAIRPPFGLKLTFGNLFGDEVNRYLRELPEPFRKALLLCDLEGLSYDEIAEVLEVPIGTVRSRISRGRAFLKERLVTYAQELGYGRG